MTDRALRLVPWVTGVALLVASVGVVWLLADAAGRPDMGRLN